AEDRGPARHVAALEPQDQLRQHRDDHAERDHVEQDRDEDKNECGLLSVEHRGIMPQSRHTHRLMADDPLWLDAETMRALGRDAVDLITSRLSRPWDATPIVSALSPDELAARLSEPAPEGPRDFA